MALMRSAFIAASQNGFLRRLGERSSLGRKLSSRFVAGMEIEANSPDFADAIGELSNMIAGGAKKDLGALATITVPTVVIGANHCVARLSDVPCIVIPCATPAGDFAVEINIKQLAKPH